MRALTDEELAFFRANGFVVVRGAVSPAQSRTAAEALWSFLEMRSDDPEGWYRPPARPGVSSVEMYHHQAFWDTRQAPRVYGAFVDILGDEQLWVSFDRASFKPPLHPLHLDYDFKGFIHWDDDPAAMITHPLKVQGVLSLTDTDETMGGFQCVPGHHLRLEEWLARRRDGPGRLELGALSAAALARSAAFSGYPAEDVIRPSTVSGDLIIWDQRLPHGNGRNVSVHPRLAQYITMLPTGETNAALRDARVRAWRTMTSPPGAEGDPREWERRHCVRAELTDLGRLLLGLDMWAPVGGS